MEDSTAVVTSKKHDVLEEAACVDACEATEMTCKVGTSEEQMRSRRPDPVAW